MRNFVLDKENYDKILKNLFGDVGLELVRVMNNINLKDFEERLKALKME